MKVYYQDYYLDEGIASDDPREGDLEFALNTFYDLTDEENNFFGIEDNAGKCIQFMWESQDKWLVDIPQAPSNISFQKYSDYEECVVMIKETYRKNSITIFDGLYKIDTMKETLDGKVEKPIGQFVSVHIVPFEKILSYTNLKSGKKSEYQVPTKNMKSGKKNFDDYDPKTKEFIDYKDWNNGYPPKGTKMYETAIKDARVQAEIAQEHGTVTRWEFSTKEGASRMQDIIEKKLDDNLQKYIKIVVNPK